MTWWFLLWYHSPLVGLSPAFCSPNEIMYIRFALASSSKIFPEKLWFTIESDSHLCFHKSKESNMSWSGVSLSKTRGLPWISTLKVTPKIHWSLVVPKKNEFYATTTYHRNIWKATKSHPKKSPPYTTSVYPAQRHRETGRVSRWYIPKRWRHQNLRVVRLPWVPSQKTHPLRWKRVFFVAFWKRFPWASS